MASLSTLQVTQIRNEVDADHLLRQESQMLTRQREPAQASEEAARDRERLPHLCPLDITSASIADSRVVRDAAQNVFLFANPKSGGNAAAAFMEAGLEYIRLTCSEPVNLWIWDIRQGNTGQKPGFLKLRSVVNSLAELQREGMADANDPAKPTPLVFVIVAGGDGTVMWCITELWAHQINDDFIAIGVVPYGTGNDLARALGWQKFNAARPYDQKFRVLKQLISEWLAARIVWHDIWEVSLKVQPEGSFQKIDPSTRNKKAVSGVKARVAGRLLTRTISVLETSGNILGTGSFEARELTLKMCNYFSIGIESRIGIGFDRYRTTSQFRNKLRYAIEGCKKACFRRTPSIDRIISEVVEHRGDEPRTIFSYDRDPRVVHSTMTLIASNVPSFAAGLDLWSSSRSRGVVGSDTAHDGLLDHQQRMGDGSIEFLSFTGVMAMGIERAVRGQGKRVAFGDGPFTINFHETSGSTGLRKDTRIYFQVDGEFFVMTRPQSASIKLIKRVKMLTSPSLNEEFIDQHFIKVV